jgi:KDO2-lipid IV(A) lauroyltransferase
MRSRARIAKRNLELCFPDLSAVERERLLDAHFESLGLGLLEMPFAWWSSREQIARLGELQGLEHLEAAAAEGRGVLLLSGHFTCLEIAGRILMDNFLYHPMYRRMNNAVIEHVASRKRSTYGVTTIPRDDVKRVIRTLRAGETIWYAPDQNIQRRKGVFVKFFGHLASTTPATHKLARMTGARVVPCMAVRKRDGSGYLLVVEPALEDFPTDDIIADTQRINDIIERWVREYPEQYLWIHRRFRSRPPSDDRPMY